MVACSFRLLNLVLLAGELVKDTDLACK